MCTLDYSREITMTLLHFRNELEIIFIIEFKIKFDILETIHVDKKWIE